MSRRSVGKINTETLLIIGGIAVIGIYFLTRPPQAIPIPGGGTLLTGSGGSTYYPGDPTASIISAGGGAASSILNSLIQGGVIGN